LGIYLFGIIQSRLISIKLIINLHLYLSILLSVFIISIYVLQGFSLDFYLIISSNDLEREALPDYLSISNILVLSSLIIYPNRDNFNSQLYKLLINISLIIFLIVVVLLGARFPLLILILFYLYFLLKNYRNSNTYILIIAILLSFSFFSDTFSNIGKRSYERIYSLIDGTDSESIDERIEMAKNSKLLFYENPLFGSGIGSYSAIYGKGLRAYPHNIILELLAEIGLIGLFLFFLVVISPAFSRLNLPLFLKILFLFVCIQYLKSGTYSEMKDFYFILILIYIFISEKKYKKKLY